MTQTSPGGFIRTEDQILLDIEALRLHSTGLSFQKVADRLGVVKSTAYERVQRALKDVPVKDVEEYRKVMDAQLDEVLEIALQKALSGDKGAMFAIDRVITILDRKSRLMGLDTPVVQKLEVTRYEGGADLDREFRELAELYSRDKGLGGEGAVGAETGEAGTTT